MRQVMKQLRADRPHVIILVMSIPTSSSYISYTHSTDFSVALSSTRKAAFCSFGSLERMLSNCVLGAVFIAYT